MGFFSKFEGKMEDAFEGVADRMGNSPISPVQIAKKAEKQMRREKMVGAGKQYVPTLYTVLVNPDDDNRLFGYYPTLAGETETYLAAKAAEQGLAMDGQPLVRFIVDDSLKHGKFDVIAETVAAPIVSQLRMEEMERYGMGNNPAAFGQQQGFAQQAGYMPQAPQNPAMMSPAFDPQQQMYQQQAQPYAQPPMAGSASPQNFDPYAQTAYPEARQQEAFFVDPYANRQVVESGGQMYEEQISYNYGNSAPFQDYANSETNYADSAPLPDVPENEIDRSINYGEYTFDSQNFLDEQQQRESEFAQEGQQAWGVTPTPIGAAAGMGAGAVAGRSMQAAAGNVHAAVNNTVMFAGQPGQQQGHGAAPRAYLFNQTEQRLCNLIKSRILIGRESKNDLTLRDINASRTHAELRFEPQGVWVITDLGSTNGTYVNGRRIASQPLFNGDRIDIGTTTLIFNQE